MDERSSETELDQGRACMEKDRMREGYIEITGLGKGMPLKGTWHGKELGLKGFGIEKKRIWSGP